MRLALCSSFLPFVDGGARFIVEWLAEKLLERGHQVERVYLPFSDYPRDLLAQMAAYRSIKIDGADRVICLRPPAHLIQHPDKVLWFIHHFRVFYDLWNSEWSPPHTRYNESLRRAIFQADGIALREARTIFTNSRRVQQRLMNFNEVESTVLYPPLLSPSAYYNAGYNDEVLYVSRLISHKRQHLLVEALAEVKTAVRARICGEDPGGVYAKELLRLASALGVSDRLVIENRWISDEEKREIMARSLAVVYFPVDEDSYGYVSLEGAHSSKPLITTTDSGGVLEFVVHERNGLVCDPKAESIGAALDRLYSDRRLAEELGHEAKETVEKLRINWDNVVAHLLA